MRILSAVIVLVAGSSLVCAQAPSSQSAAPPSAAQAAPMDHAMPQEMMQQHMQEMKGQLDSMRAKIADMRTKLAKVKDPAAKQALQADLELWETMAGHMESMQKMPPAEHGPGMAMHHEGGAGCCAGMMGHENKGDDHGMSCRGGGKCMQGKATGSIAPEAPAPPAN